MENIDQIIDQSDSVEGKSGEIDDQLYQAWMELELQEMLQAANENYATAEEKR